MIEVRGVALQLRIDLEDDLVLVALGVDSGNLPLREGLVQRRWRATFFGVKNSGLTMPRNTGLL
jgi:hypothetical protein